MSAPREEVEAVARALHEISDDVLPFDLHRTADRGARRNRHEDKRLDERRERYMEQARVAIAALDAARSTQPEEGGIHAPEKGERWRVITPGGDEVFKVMPVAEHEAALAQEREKAQRWLDADVKNMDAIERLESERDALEEALEPFIRAKPRPRAGSATDNSDRYELYVSGEMLRAARAALALPSGDGENANG